MRLKVIIFAATMLLPGFWVVSGVSAQDAAKSPAAASAPAATPAAPDPGKKFYLEVDAADLAAISQALAELPKRIADPLILRLNGQLQNQTMISGPAEKALEPKKKK